MATHYAQALAAFATFSLQGIDSQVATGPVTNAQAQVSILDFDSDPTGQAKADTSNGRITQASCDDPQIPPNVCSDPDGLPFECSP